MRRIISFVLILALIFSCGSFSKLTEQAVYADEVTIEPDNEEIPVENESTSKTEVPEETPLTESTNTPGPTENTTPKPTDTPIPTDTPEPIIYDLGDVDGSSIIDATDALYVLKNAAKLTVLDEPELIAADVDKSGNIDAKDALYILQYAAKIIVRFVFTPEENFQILKDYIKENGVADETGVYTISRDYVAEGVSTEIVDIDTFIYNSNEDSLTYKYNIAFNDDKKSFEAEYTILLYESETKIKIDWTENHEKKYVKMNAEQNIVNSDLKFQDDLSVNYKKGNRTVINRSDLQERERDQQIENDINYMIDAQMHMALLSMENYLINTSVIRLKDLGFDSYKYTDVELYEKMACLYNIDLEIQNNLIKLKDFLLKNGTKEGNEYYISTTSSQSRDFYDIQSAEGDYYIVYNQEYNTIYFTGTIYHYSLYSETLNGYVTQVTVFPFYDRTIYYNVNIYKPRDYELEYQVEGVYDSFDVNFPNVGLYTCIYPEKGYVDNTVSELIPYDVALLIEQACSHIYIKTRIDKSGLGFICYNN